MMPDSSMSAWEPEIQPRQTLWQRLDAAARHMLPSIFIAFIIILFSAPIPLPGAAELLPAIVIATVFFWSFWRPSGMPSVAVFILGLFMDLVGFTPLGVSAFILLLVHGVGLYARFGLMRLHFLLVWGVFSLLATAACLLQWGLTCLFRFHMLDVAPALFEAFLCIGVYPPLSALFSWVFHMLDDKEEP
ncbi:rod shape-determining protein MreD [Acetobacter indonesiensis]|uniref:rod shape-determining protein MreD n=1 Tax=Acetobacter indonesiensis TaxID=104101 RepID=UPI0020A4A4A2|nr:rod shape-determining protein MreD [Acetobacter indonesiensis]MCP1230198.1 rod shape-determining protein MreD [Acetobacter indonesiensis]